MLISLKCRLYPNAAQSRRLNDYIDAARHVFNQALEQRIHACKDGGKGINYYDQQKQITLQRVVDAKMTDTPADVQRDGLRRVDSAFKNFFRRCKEGAKKKGFPRFKSANRYNSFTSTLPGQCVKDGRIHVVGMKQTIRCRGLQPCQHAPKRLTIVRRAGKWFARILIDDGRPLPDKKSIATAVGIDLGLNAFVATSDGLKVVAPRFFRNAATRLRRAQQRVSRRQRGSKRRAWAQARVQTIHAKIADCRDDFTHKLSKFFATNYDLIVTEKLNVKGMVRGRLAKSILDAGWSQFTRRLEYKAANAGATYLQVNPSGTSQECGKCGGPVPKTLSDRVHNCPACGVTEDRDVNSGVVIRNRGLDLYESQHPGAVGVGLRTWRVDLHQQHSPLASRLREMLCQT